MNIYLKVVPYLAQWAQNEFGGTMPIDLPKRSPERDVIEHFIQKRPDNLQSDILKNANLVIRIPSFRDKNPERGYTYLPDKARKLLIHRLKVRFNIELMEDLYTLKNSNKEITKIIEAWMEKHGIEDTARNTETIRQIFYRKRKSYEKK